MHTFCTCTDFSCEFHQKHTGDCGECILKNLERHEIPACFWHKIGQDGGAQSDYSLEKFAQKVMAAAK